MTDHVARLYALALGALVFLMTWAVVAANPFPEAAPAPDSRLVALGEREERLARRQKVVNRVVARRFATYRRELSDQQRVQAALGAAPSADAAPPAAAPASAPAVPAAQVTSLPPVTSSGSS